MKTVILCGGMGTRIRDANENLPKPLLPIGGKPILWHIMKGYAHHGFKDFVLCLGYKGWSIKEFFLNYQRLSSDLLVTLGPQWSVTPNLDISLIGLLGFLAGSDRYGVLLGVSPKFRLFH